MLKERLAQHPREEEIRWLQRAKTKKLLQGDNNTQMANGKRNARIYRLEEEGIIEGEEKLDSTLQNIITNCFYTRWDKKGGHTIGP